MVLKISTGAGGTQRSMDMRVKMRTDDQSLAFRMDSKDHRKRGLAGLAGTGGGAR